MRNDGDSELLISELKDLHQFAKRGKMNVHTRCSLVSDKAGVVD
jgi:hypothetical protein